MVIVSPTRAARGAMEFTYGSPGFAEPGARTGICSLLMNRSPRLLPLGVITYTRPEFASSGIVRLMRVSPHSPYSEEVGEMPEMRTSAVLRSWPKYRPVTIMHVSRLRRRSG